MRKVNYDKLSYMWHASYLRWAKRVEKSKLICQDCGGMGGWTEPVLDFGEGPWMTCGWCQGTGKLDAWHRGAWLRCKKEEKRMKTHGQT